MNTADQHAAALAIVHEEAGRTLSKDDFDLCMRIAKRALPSDAAQAPMAWARPDVAERLSSPLAIGVLTELMKKQKDGYVPIYAAPVAPAAAALERSDPQIIEAANKAYAVGLADGKMLGALDARPIYQIGAPGIAGHQVVWWDVPQEEYERQKAAGFMRTGIVYRKAT